MEDLNIYYVSLCRGLIGYYVKFLAPDESTVRKHCLEYFGRLWCSIYDESEFNKIVSNTKFSYKPYIVNDNPIELKTWEWD